MVKVWVALVLSALFGVPKGMAIVRRQGQITHIVFYLERKENKCRERSVVAMK